MSGATLAGRVAHDVGLAALLGGNLFGRLAMHPALGGLSLLSDAALSAARR